MQGNLSIKIEFWLKQLRLTTWSRISICLAQTKRKSWENTENYQREWPEIIASQETFDDENLNGKVFPIFSSFWNFFSFWNAKLNDFFRYFNKILFYSCVLPHHKCIENLFVLFVLVWLFLYFICMVNKNTLLYLPLCTF